MIRRLLENMILIGSGMIIILVIWYMFLYGIIYGVPTDFHKVPGTNITHITTQKVYHPGDMVWADVIADKKVNLVGFVLWVLDETQESYKTRLATDKAAKPFFESYKERVGFLHQGKQDIIVPVERIPLNVPYGEYHFKGYIKYDMGIGLTLVAVETNDFKVKK
jgi:hypothetical protein